ncbi:MULTISPECIES: AAA family ATPase [Bacillus]|uniref:AAA family ATPase n=1 Tax=Bacillus TaxID=1386 RepID=UPI0006831F02|nr:AAA family ATPase [Bacillus altitudinis]AKU31459.1 hypothetical protein ID12_08495 [Bacillus altitudinis]
MNKVTESYVQKFIQIKTHISNLKEYYIWFSDNQNTLKNIINLDKQRLNLSTLDMFYKNIDYRITNLLNSEEAIDNIIENITTLSISTQYNMYLERELLSINFGNYHLTSQHNKAIFKNFIESLRIQNSLGTEEFNALDVLKMIIHQGIKYENELIGKVASVRIFNNIQHIENNIVIIGPNGSGKSTFARNLNGKLKGNISIISAQHLLIYMNPTSISVGRDMQEQVRSFQRINKLGSDEDLLKIITKDLENLMIALFDEKAERADRLYNMVEERKESLLDQTISIWESLITHRKLKQNSRYGIHVETLDGKQYDFNSLSEGEKAVFYYIGHILLADKDSYIIIDEPENHLHLSICIRMWDLLENYRSDCKFIYITHNIDFAVSRNNKTLIWNKHYEAPFSWDFSIIKKDDNIPERLLLEIMGSRKDVLFCEGDDRNSLDFKIYSRIFSKHNVIPVGGHDNVINYCKSFNANQSVGRLRAYGIIDGDTWSEAQRQKYKENNIFVLPFNEIENAMCQKVFLNKIIEETVGDPQKINEFEEGLIKYASREKNKISTWYANNKINNQLKHNLLIEMRDIEALKAEVSQNINIDLIESYYNEMLSKIDNDIYTRNFNSLIVYLNGKKAISTGLGNKLLPNFEEGFIRLMDQRGSFKELVIQELRDKYFYELGEPAKSS